MNFLKNFFAVVSDTKKGVVVLDELYRSLLTSLGTGSFMALALAILQNLLSDVTAIFPNPIAGGLATMVLTIVMDLLRRMSQGGSSIPAPAPTPTPVVVVPVPAPTPTPAPAA